MELNSILNTKVWLLIIATMHMIMGWNMDEAEPVEA